MEPKLCTIEIPPNIACGHNLNPYSAGGTVITLTSRVTKSSPRDSLFIFPKSKRLLIIFPTAAESIPSTINQDDNTTYICHEQAINKVR